jgi:hypothetical protein
MTISVRPIVGRCKLFVTYVLVPPAETIPTTRARVSSSPRAESAECPHLARTDGKTVGLRGVGSELAGRPDEWLA